MHIFGHVAQWTRASVFGTESRRFESCRGLHASVAQWTRATGFYPVGRGFESFRGYSKWYNYAMRRKIPGYPRHELTRDGQLFLDGEPAKVFVGRNGYRQAYIYRGKRRTKHPKMIYKLMARTFLPRRPSKEHLVRHLDGNSLNDHADNLAWGTHADNMQDLRKHREGRASLTKALKADILKALKRKKTWKTEDLEKLAKKHNVAFSTVNRLYWKIKDGKA